MYKVLYFWIFLFLISCQKNENGISTINPEVLTVPLGNEKLNASLLFERIDYLRLKGNGILYPSKVDQLEYIDDEILIMDKSLGAIFKFSNNGDLIGILNRPGQGPEEYQYLHRCIVDKKNERIEVYDKVGQKILVFDQGLNFVESFKIGLYFENFVKTDSKEYLVYTAQDNLFNSENLTNNLLLWKNGQIEFSAISRKGTDSKFQVRGMFPNYVKNEVIFVQSFSDTIYNYSVKEKLINRKIVVNFQYPLTEKFSSLDEIDTYSLENSFSSSIDNLLISKDVLSFNYIHFENSRMSTMSYYFFPEKNKYVSSKALYNDFDNFNLFKHSNLKEDVFINVIEPEYLSLIDIEKTSKEFQNSLDLNIPFEDQFILLFLKLKNPSQIIFD